MYTIILRPRVSPIDAGMLPLVIAVGLADALDEVGVPDVQIAWPNDIIASGVKVAGILCELSADQERVTWAIAGMGINVGPVPEVASTRWTAGSLAAIGPRPRRGDLLVAALAAIGRRYEAWIEHGPTAVVSAFAKRDHLAGAQVTVGTTAGEVTGVCRGIDDLGRLQVERRGVIHAVASGEVTGVNRRGT
jgi:BirA family biotin operon repressor/biotin-[acetyl-CoA-carboxylase] ligase